MMHRKDGFTLIELLVVIAIIAVLLSILMPALSKVRQQAYTIRCRANLKQYGVGMRMYLDDNDSYFPNTGSWMKSASGSWVKKGEEPTGQFWPYILHVVTEVSSLFSV
jgi:prepilin-type N-terminal cleavage/methylation domain-containing protein